MEVGALESHDLAVNSEAHHLSLGDLGLILQSGCRFSVLIVLSLFLLEQGLTLQPGMPLKHMTPGFIGVCCHIWLERAT